MSKERERIEKLATEYMGIAGEYQGELTKQDLIEFAAMILDEERVYKREEEASQEDK